MSDLIVFGFGAVVTSIVAAAVLFLFWGVSNEPSMLEVPGDEVAAHPLPHQAVPGNVSDSAPSSVPGPSAAV